MKIITAFKQEQEKDVLICNNRQCMACEYLVGRSYRCTCNYLGMTNHSRGCDIPFCKRFKLKKGKRTPKHLTKKDFANWYRIYDPETYKQLAEDKEKRGSDGDKQDDQGRAGVHPGPAEVSAAEAEEADRQRRAEQLRQRAILWGRRRDPRGSSSGSSERDDRTDAGQS